MPQLDAVRCELERTLDHARLLTRAASARMTVRPQPARWSVADCLEHLNLTTRAYLPKLEAALEEARRREARAQEPFGLEWTARGLKWMLEPPVRVRLPTTAPMQPAPQVDGAKVMADFEWLQERLFDYIKAGRGWALNRVRLSSPFSERVKYNAYAALVLIAVHQRRHLWQAEQVLKELG